MSRSIRQKIEEANQITIERILNAQPVLVDVRPAIEVIPRMEKNMILYAGPPIEWERMCGPQKGGVIAAIIYEGLAENPEDAIKLAEAGKIKLEPCHHHNTVGSMTGVTSASMWVHVVKNRDQGNFAFCALYEGRGKTSAFGCYDNKVIQRLYWMKETLGPALREAVKDAGEIDLKSIIARSLSMGDECHNRSTAATLSFMDAIMPYLLETDFSKDVIAQIIKFMTIPHYNYFLTLSMPACKATMDAAHNIENSTIVTVMARNGTDFGIRVSGLGDQWFTAPSNPIDGLYFPGYGPEDANPDMGDSSITETAGLGGFAMAAAPAIVQLVGGTVKDAIRYTEEMREITVTNNNSFQIPYVNFEGTPTGIDVRKVLETGILPIIDTGIAHKDPNIGHIGAGIVRPPMECFEQALKRIVRKLGA